MKKFIEGSHAVAETIKKCKPKVICAYPITPQTHIVERLADFVANGELTAEFVNVESEHSAASVVLGASATGVRAYTSTSSQGLLLMTEVLFNIAGMRLPVVLTVVNRSVSAPINIWCFTADAEVLMADLTYRKISNIKVGETVIGKDKNGYLVPTRVTKTYVRECEKLVNLKTKNFTLTCTPEHKFYYHPVHNHWIQAKSLKNKNLPWVGYGYGISKEFIRGWLAGIIDGDGSFFIDKKNRHTFRINVKDKEIINSLIKYASYFGFNIRRKDYRKREGLYGAVITKTSEANRFKRFLKKNKNVDFCRGYLAGIYDAEGTGPHKIKQAVIYNKNKYIVEIICDYLEFLKFNFRRYIDKDNIAQVKINNVPEFFVKCRPLLSRKRNNIFKTTLKSIKSKLKILNVELIKKKRKVYNLETNTHNYVVNGFLVHNCDHQDSMTIRDAGFMQFYGESIQDVCDLHLIAYRIAEDKEIMLPAMVCMDGYILSHAHEVVDLSEEELIDKFLPPYKPLYKLDIENPLSMGLLADPSYYMETRWAIQETQKQALDKLPELEKEFEKTFNRKLKVLVEGYKLEDAEKALVAMGSVCGTIKEVVDELRGKGEKVGLLKIVSYRPFPEKMVYNLLKDIPKIGVLEKAISLGSKGPLFLEISSLLQTKNANNQINGFIAGLGGRDIKPQTIKEIFSLLEEKPQSSRFIDIKEWHEEEFPILRNWVKSGVEG
jgi:pyruvate/2-oxoacid:ferredoxin oxidoreductase alpha subunit